MTFKKAKLFRFKKDQNERITCISYDDNEEYYSFLREYRSKGYRQVIITTEIMIKIIETSVLNDNLFVYKIELAEEDEELEKEIDQLLTKTQHNSSYFALLLEKIQFLSERSSIDLFRVYVKNQYQESTSCLNFFLQSNGIIGIDSEHFENQSKKICEIVEEYLF